MTSSAGNTPAITAPGPRTRNPFGSLGELRRDSLQFLTRVAWDYGDVVRFRLGPSQVHLLRHPDHIRHILTDNNTNYGRQTFGYAKLRMALGLGLVTSEGDFWRRQRRIAQPAFHRERIAHFATVMVELADAMVERWQAHIATGAVVDVADEMMRLTLAIVGRTLFSTDLSSETDEMGRAVTEIQESITDHMMRMIVLPRWAPTPGNRRFARAIRSVDSVVLGKIATRRADKTDPGDLLSMLMHAQDEEEGGGTMTDRQLRDELVTMISAGHETTANALAWTWYLLSKHPSEAAKLHAELATVLGGRLPTLADLPRLEYTTMLIKESMRLFPPVWLIPRSTITDDQVGKYRIPAGSIVMLSPYVTHRHPEFWENPEGFEPERFLPERLARQPKYAYFPFGGGPHQCIGNSFAMMEAQLIVATVAQRCRLNLVPGHAVDKEPLITLRPRYGMKMTIRDGRAS